MTAVNFYPICHMKKIFINIFLCLLSAAPLLSAKQKTATPDKKNIKKEISFFSESQDIFPIPDSLKADVDFWERVYREWDINQVVFYDSKTKIVYEVLDLPRVENDLSSMRYKAEVAQKKKAILDVMAAAKESKKISKNDEPIYSVLKKHSLLHEEDLVSRMRAQNGLRSQFEKGLSISGRYVDDMRAVLKSHNLPEELLALVFVESLFYSSAVSHAGARGLWGFLPESARMSGIHVNNFTDERDDHVLSTLGACQYLKESKRDLQAWPVTITSYNYGRSGMRRAVNNLGTTDFEVILQNHESPIFGYASRNYYAEYLAALRILREYQKHFPNVKLKDRWTYETVQILRPVEVSDLISFKVIDKNHLSEFNPSLTKRTLEGYEVIPPNYVLRVDQGKANFFYQQLKKIPNDRRNLAANKVSRKYVAKGKESLFRIAKKFGISVDFLVNKLGKSKEYQPNGALVIRSQSHLFSPLLNFKDGLGSLVSTQTSEKPTEIGRRVP